MDVVAGELLPKVTLSVDGSKKLHMFSVYNGMIMRDHLMSDLITTVHDQYQLYVEEIPLDEYECENDELKLQCFHFTADITRTHSVPFTLVMAEVSDLWPFVHWRRMIKSMVPDSNLTGFFSSSVHLGRALPRYKG